MDGLRWLLLLFGALVIAGVYFYSRRTKTSLQEQADPTHRLEPGLTSTEQSTEDPDAGRERVPVLTDVNQSPSDRVEPQADLPQKIVTVRIVAQANKSFPGEDLILGLRGIGLRHGKFGIFHRYDGSDTDQTVFSAASLVEPGSFDLENIKDQKIPGISLFLVLPGPIDSIEAFDMMMTASRALGQALNGELLDESGSTLSIQRERYLREEIIQFQHASLVS
jgi:cell division protein ZipA